MQLFSFDLLKRLLTLPSIVIVDESPVNEIVSLYSCSYFSLVAYLCFWFSAILFAMCLGNNCNCSTSKWFWDHFSSNNFSYPCVFVVVFLMKLLVCSWSFLMSFQSYFFSVSFNFSFILFHFFVLCDVFLKFSLKLSSQSLIQW